MKESGTKAMGIGDEKMKPLFSKGEGQKQERGESLWNKEGLKFFRSAQEKWKET